MAAKFDPSYGKVIITRGDNPTTQLVEIGNVLDTGQTGYFQISATSSEIEAAKRQLSTMGIDVRIVVQPRRGETAIHRFA